MIFDIVTPTYNRDRFLGDTLKSVLEQDFAGQLNLFVMDGGSTDQSVSLAAHWQRRAANGTDKVVDIEVGNDMGMYDAIYKGFQKGRGDLMGWINSDDVYLPNAFKAVHQVFLDNPDVDWISGIPSTINTEGSITGVRTSLPYKARGGLRRGIYNFKNKLRLCPEIQQDCVFWRRSLWGKLDPAFFSRFRHMRYAGDHALWMEFAKHSRLHHVECALSCFRVHGDQLTASLEGYAAEMGVRRPSWRDTAISALLNLRHVAPSVFRGFWRQPHDALCEKVGAGFIAWDDGAGKWTRRN